MPLYDFACPQCSTKTEHFIREVGPIPEVLPCPYCGNEKSKRVAWSPTSFQIHGASMANGYQ